MMFVTAVPQTVIDARRSTLDSIPLLDADDAVKIYQQNTGGFLLVIDPATLTLKVPAFQCVWENGELKRDHDGLPVVNPNVMKVFIAQNAGASSHRLIIDGWFMLDWWMRSMKFDVREPDTMAFRPIDVVDNELMLGRLVDWFKGWADESYG
jgi:hypothetical protein